MRTVLYLEWTRKREDMIRRLIANIGIVLLLFLVCSLLDIAFPKFNSTYMKWPDMLKDLLGIGSWNSHLFLNVWQVLALVFPFYLIYVMMINIANGIMEEDRLETVVYLRNAGITGKDIFVGKTCVWLGYVMANVIILFVMMVIFALVLKAPRMAANVVRYHVQLGLLSILYSSIAVFLAAADSKKENVSDVVAGILVLPCVLSRIPAIMRFFAELLTITGRQGAVVDNIAIWGEKLRVLTILSPVSWCWTGIDIRGMYIVCGIIITIILAGTSYSIYCHNELHTK